MAFCTLKTLLSGAFLATALLGPAAASADEQPGPDTTPPVVALSPAEISGVLVTANNGEIQQANLAMSRSVNPFVRAYAQRMMTDHSRANRELISLDATLGILPTVSTTSTEMQMQGDVQYHALIQLYGPSFDTAYMDGQIQAHTQLLQFVQGRIVPTEAAQPFGAMLLTTSATIARHLDLATAVRRMLDD
jgi:putative membrane protein